MHNYFIGDYNDLVDMIMKATVAISCLEDLEEGTWGERTTRGSKESDVFDPGGAEVLDHNRSFSTSLCT